MAGIQWQKLGHTLKSDRKLGHILTSDRRQTTGTESSLPEHEINRNLRFVCITETNVKLSAS